LLYLSYVIEFINIFITIFVFQVFLRLSRTRHRTFGSQTREGKIKLSIQGLGRLRFSSYRPTVQDFLKFVRVLIGFEIARLAEQ
jgi:hypothetical protein